MALTTIGVITALYMYTHYRKPGKNILKKDYEVK